MPMPKGWPCLPTPSEHAVISLLKKKKELEKIALNCTLKKISKRKKNQKRLG